MPTRVAMQDGKVAVYEVPTLTSSDDAPLTDPANNVSRLGFHSDREYIEIRNKVSLSVTLPARGHNTQVKTDHLLFAHGLASAPMVFGRIKNIYWNNTGPHVVPLLGSVMIPIDTGTAGYHSNDTLLQRWVCLLSDDTNVYLREFGHVAHEDVYYYNRDHIGMRVAVGNGVTATYGQAGWTAKTLDLDIYVSNYLVTGPASGYNPALPLANYENNVLTLGRGKFSSEWRRLFKDAGANDYAVVAGKHMEWGTKLNPNGNGVQFLHIVGVHHQVDATTLRIENGSPVVWAAASDTPTFTATVAKSGVY